MKNLIYIIICVFMSGFGQILLKHGMNGTNLELSSSNIMQVLTSIKYLYLISGILVYGASFFYGYIYFQKYQ